MRKLPEFPHYRVATQPVAKRWLGAGAVIVLLSALVATLVQKSGTSARITLTCMVGMAFLVGVLWLIRHLFFRLSVHHSLTWSREVESERSRWWKNHQRQFALNEIVLIGPAGTELSDWLQVIKREQSAPPLREEPPGKVLRIAQTFSSDPLEREKQLAQMLVLQWKKQRDQAPVIFPEKYIWLGSAEAWQAFVAQLDASFPGVKPPEHPDIWQGEETLSLLAEVLNDDGQQTRYLIAGCHSLSPSSDAFRPAGESAVLWIAGSRGDVTLSRGEVFEPSETESFRQVISRAEKQSELDESPDTCILFSHPSQPELAGCGWNVTHNIQDDYWGEQGNLDALIVISLAAMLAKSEAKPCGWIASDPLHALVTGVVKPYGNG